MEYGACIHFNASDLARCVREMDEAADRALKAPRGERTYFVPERLLDRARRLLPSLRVEAPSRASGDPVICPVGPLDTLGNNILVRDGSLTDKKGSEGLGAQ